MLACGKYSHIVGMIGVRLGLYYEKHGVYGQIVALSVEHEQRGQHIASSLVAEGERWLKTRGVQTIIVNRRAPASSTARFMGNSANDKSATARNGGCRSFPRPGARAGNDSVGMSVRRSIAQFAYEQLSVATMKYKARTMNAYLRASHLMHIPKQIAWGAAKRRIHATRVKSAYTSQEYSVCYYVDRANRPDQQTLCCGVCGYQAHADLNAALNVARRMGDTALFQKEGTQ